MGIYSVTECLRFNRQPGHVSLVSGPGVRPNLQEEVRGLTYGTWSQMPHYAGWLEKELKL